VSIFKGMGRAPLLEADGRNGSGCRGDKSMESGQEPTKHATGQEEPAELCSACPGSFDFAQDRLRPGPTQNDRVYE